MEAANRKKKWIYILQVKYHGHMCSTLYHNDETLEGRGQQNIARLEHVGLKYTIDANMRHMT